jgi:PAS domain S-box-containing protein
VRTTVDALEPTPATEEELDREAASRALAMSRHARDAIMLVRADGTIFEVNPAAELLYERSRAELVGLHVSDLRPPEARESVAAQFHEALKAGLTFETVHRRADGSEFPVEVSSVGADMDGERVVVSVVRDISRRRQRELECDALVDELSFLNERLDAMLSLVSSALGIDNVDRLVSELLAALKDVMSADAALLFVPEGEAMRLQAIQGLHGTVEVPPGFRLLPGQGFAHYVAETADVVWVRDVQSSKFGLPVHQRVGSRSILGVPLYAEGRLQGVLECLWSEHREVSEAERVMLRLAAERISTALQTATLYDRSRRAERLSAALVDVSALVNASLDPDQTIENGLRVVVEALGASGAVLATHEGEALRIRYASGIPLAGQVVPPAHPLREVEGTVRAQTAAHGSAEAEWAADVLGFAHTAVVPVRVGKGLDGALLVGRAFPDDPPFDDLEQDFISRLAVMLGSALTNADRFEVEHHIADTLQESLLTVPREVPGIRFASLYRSATVSSRVGGDFYDVFPIAEGRVGVLIGDVSGKGLEAAMVTTLVKDTVRAYAHEHPSPAEVMARANAVLHAASRLPAFASAILAVIHVNDGEVTYCCAGHPPAVVIRGDAIEETVSESPVIGAFAEMEFVDQQLTLGPTDVLFLYTDGVLEARSEEGFYGEERLLAALAARAQYPLTALPQAILAEVETFASGRLSDDIAMLAVALDRRDRPLPSDLSAPEEPGVG